MAKSLVLPTLILGALFVFPISMGNLKFVPIYKTMVVKANKKLPPHVAYLETHFKEKNNEWVAFEKTAKQPLNLESSAQYRTPYVITQRRDLQGVTIKRSAEIVIPKEERVYKTSMQAAQENESPHWLKNIVRVPATTVLAQGPTVPEEVVHNLTASRRITGPIEITGGLAVTNEHHIEIRRSDEGIFREMGRVDLMKGSYSIDIDETSGAIVARLLNKSGAVLGEGSIRLSLLSAGSHRLIQGPRLEISPSPTWTGSVSSYYGSSKGGPPPQTRVTSFGGQSNVDIGEKGEISFEKLSKNSSTVVRAETPDHMPTNKILVTGSKTFGVTMFPNSMMNALKGIVAEHRPVSRAALAQTTIVWGTVSLDGKPLSGVSVSSETEPDSVPIYFNEFMIPDLKLTSTSSNGLYAFVDIPQGFHALLAKRGEAYFGHQNVLVEEGSVAIGDIENTLRTEPVRLRAFDAFSADPVAVTVNMQSLEQPLELPESGVSLVLPQVSRLSMIYTEPPAAYVAATYYYNDQDPFIHLPMISQAWLSDARVSAKINDAPTTGTVIGFFPEEEFEVYLAGEGDMGSASVIYFDATGKITDNRRGVAGGGFIIFNTPIGAQEVVIVGSQTEKIFSKIVPVDTDSVSILNFSSF